MTLLSLGATTVAGYRVHTGDQDSDDTAVTGALLEAESLVEEHLRRLLPLEPRTESLTINPDGRVYPPAWPITVASLVIDGRSLKGATPDSGPFIGYIDFEPPYRMSVTWTGGFDATSLPVTLREAIYDLAKPLVLDAQPVPVGAKSVQLGDASITYGDSVPSGSIDALVPGLSARIGRYKNRYAA